MDSMGVLHLKLSWEVEGEVELKFQLLLQIRCFGKINKLLTVFTEQIKQEQQLIAQHN